MDQYLVPIILKKEKQAFSLFLLVSKGVFLSDLTLSIISRLQGISNLKQRYFNAYHISNYILCFNSSKLALNIMEISSFPRATLEIHTYISVCVCINVCVYLCMYTYIFNKNRGSIFQSWI